MMNGILAASKSEFLDSLRAQGYAEGSIKNYQFKLNDLERYMVDNAITAYSASVGDVFLEQKRQSGQYSDGYLQHIKVAVRRFNEFVFEGRYVHWQTSCRQECPQEYRAGLDKYLNHRRLIGIREHTVAHDQKQCIKALNFFSDFGVHAFSCIKPSDVYELFEQNIDKASLVTPLRVFFRHLFKERKIEQDLSLFVPTIRRKKPVPSVYTREEMDSFLSGFDQETDKDKRDYAIVLLALRLGMRPGDISRLGISDVDFQTKKINLVQEKTDNHQHLELLPEIEDALKAYLSGERQKIAAQTIFLATKPPLRPITTGIVHNVVSKYLRKAGIEPGDRKHGGHSLRMTLASELVSEEVPHDVVRKILGHVDPGTIKHYVKFDIDSLRKCAIETPPLMGKLGKLLDAVTGGV
jgi:site-specific recombinase XerD